MVVQETVEPVQKVARRETGCTIHCLKGVAE